jgi:hypothetical protein
MWFDPKCPWAWLTSRWLLEVERARDVQVRFHVMSLAVLNDQPMHGESVRVAIAVEQHYGEDALRRLYTALGSRIHHDRQGAGRDLYAAALAEIGLPPALADAAFTDGYDDAVRASHDAGMKPVGQEVGTPIIHVPGRDGRQIAFFGPVIARAPRGEDAGRLWDGVLLVAGTEDFFELKRSRTREPVFTAPVQAAPAPSAYAA